MTHLHVSDVNTCARTRERRQGPRWRSRELRANSSLSPLMSAGNHLCLPASLFPAWERQTSLLGSLTSVAVFPELGQTRLLAQTFWEQMEAGRPTPCCGHGTGIQLGPLRVSPCSGHLREAPTAPLQAGDGSAVGQSSPP